jgi:hypothetical protein
MQSMRGFGMKMNNEKFPRLTQTLPHARKIGYCQACGQPEENSTLWQECDDQDNPEGIYLELCEECNQTKDFEGKPARKNTKRAMIVRHERMYHHVERHIWKPGLMHLCVDCVFAKDFDCSSPHRGGNLEVKGPEPLTYHIKAGRGRSGYYTNYSPATSCSGFLDGKILLEIGIGPIEFWDGTEHG